MVDETSGEEGITAPPVDGMEYPEKPEDATAMEMMQWMEEVDRYWQKRGLEKVESENR